MRSMYSGVSGLRAHQMKMDIIGNNIANVNTVGFKGQRVTFQEVFSQTIKGAGSPQAGKGGTNPHQVGLGISLSAIDTYHVRGAVQRTDNNTDLAVNGDGFFVISDSSDYLSRSYTRAGNFSLDEAGNLVSANGFKVLGYMVDKTSGDFKSNLEGLKISKSEAVDASKTTYTNFEGNLDNNISKMGAGPITLTAGPPDVVGLPSGTQYWETTYSVYDSLGGKHNLKLTFVRGLQENGAGAGGDSDWGVLIQNLETGQYFNGNDSAGAGTEGNHASAAATALVKQLEFDVNGKIDTTTFTDNITLHIPGKNGSDNFDIDVDFSEITQFRSDSTASVTESDGFPQGYLDTFTIGPTGEINGVFTNGQNKVIGRLALAIFKNPAGLEKTTENMYSVTPNSGDPILGVPGSSGMGSLNPGTLEMSNVDISREFTEMISTQRGFQANSRIITASDEMLQELVNLKR